MTGVTLSQKLFFQSSFDKIALKIRKKVTKFDQAKFDQVNSCKDILPLSDIGIFNLDYVRLKIFRL